MTSYDYFVGFEREPEDLDNFLAGQGYDRVDRVDRIHSKEGNRDYESREGELVEVYYFPEVTEVDEEDDEEVPNWRMSGRNITSDLMICTKEFNAVGEVLRLWNETANKYGGICYEPGSGHFF